MRLTVILPTARSALRQRPSTTNAANARTLRISWPPTRTVVDQRPAERICKAGLGVRPLVSTNGSSRIAGLQPLQRSWQIDQLCCSPRKLAGNSRADPRMTSSRSASASGSSSKRCRSAIDGHGRAGVPDHPLDSVDVRAGAHRERCQRTRLMIGAYGPPWQSAGQVRLGRLPRCSFFQHGEQRVPNQSVESSFAGVILADCGEHFVE
jgi:hypothetical protein